MKMVVIEQQIQSCSFYSFNGQQAVSSQVIGFYFETPHELQHILSTLFSLSLIGDCLAANLVLAACRRWSHLLCHIMWYMRVHLCLLSPLQYLHFYCGLLIVVSECYITLCVTKGSNPMFGIELHILVAFVPSCSFTPFAPTYPPFVPACVPNESRDETKYYAFVYFFLSNS